MVGISTVGTGSQETKRESCGIAASYGSAQGCQDERAPEREELEERPDSVSPASALLLLFLVGVGQHKMVSYFTRGLRLDHALKDELLGVGRFALYIRDIIRDKDDLADQVLTPDELNQECVLLLISRQVP